MRAVTLYMCGVRTEQNVAVASLFRVITPADNNMRSDILQSVLALVGLVNGIRAQAPGDGDLICINETIGNITNPFFTLHPVYSANERPLMDSRHYVRLLQESGNVYIPWQSVDRDNNNTGDVLSKVKFPL